MSTYASMHEQVLFPPGAEEDLARQRWADLGNALEYADTGSHEGSLLVVGGEEIKLPDGAVSVLKLVVDAINRGLSVLVNPQDEWVSTQEAADVLGVSRMTLVRWLDEGRIDYDKPGRHRRLRLRDVLAYKEAHTAEQHRVLGELAVKEMDQGLY
ncbi:helix-turn-helix domain-containing protein [Streptomyces sp. NPDC059690]|uniref:helix-turn-helix domain-containing protein n=1 Tax=Streptomyces sp. NPDC059690 TaxID=3346907 RepID=UPI00367BA4D4